MDTQLDLLSLEQMPRLEGIETVVFYFNPDNFIAEFSMLVQLCENL
jgi:hypothetical protein